MWKDTLEVSRDALFSVGCQIESRVHYAQRSAETAIEYRNIGNYRAAQWEYRDMLDILSNPIFEEWNFADEAKKLYPFPKKSDKDFFVEMDRALEDFEEMSVPYFSSDAETVDVAF